MTRRRRASHAGLKEVAAAANVSLMTVSRALRGREGVSEARRAEIVEIARKLNYLPNSAARSLSQTNSDLIGISLPTLYNDVFADVLDSMRGIFRHAGYSTVVETHEYDRTAEFLWVQRLLAWRPAAIVLTGHDHLPDTAGALRGAAIPTLEIWDTAPAPIDISVGIDHFACGKTLGDHVAALGYRRPAYVGAPPGYDPRADQRYRGLRAAFAGDTDWACGHVQGRNSYAAGSEGLHAVLAGTSPDVVFFLNDHFAVGGLMACRERGLRVPEDIGIVGFNALDLTAVIEPKLTTMASPRREIGGLGARRLVARLNGLDVDRTATLTARIVTGCTTRPQG